MKRHRRRASLFVLLVGCTAATSGLAQRGGTSQPPPTSRAAAPIDLTGYWFSVVSEDWRYRMTTAPKGDYAGVPLNPAGRQTADTWDPAKDAAAGEECRAYGAAGLMRMPGRLRVTWLDDETLSIEASAGAQTRRLSFRGPGTGDGGWQGISVATWDRGESAMARGGFFPGAASRGGSLKIVTTKMRPGYLRRNGVPYSANATMTEYVDRFDLPNGEALLVVSTEVVDPTYLATPFWTSTHFAKQGDATGWKPTPCSAR
jgi:hypothetical protein